MAVGREMTKVHESVVRGTLADARAYYGNRTPRGEVTLVVAGLPAGDAPEPDPEVARTLARALLAEEGATPSSVAKEVAKRLNLPRNLAYQVVQEAKEG